MGARSVPVMAGPIRVVHVVAKTHLDLGFTALAAEVEQQYLEEFFPRALATAAALRTAGDERLVWTTGSWILHRALADPDRDRSAAVAAAIERGDLSWHAFPLTFHTELMDVPLVRAALGISTELDERFGRRTTAAKMTDVPGHTRGLVPLLAEAGVTFLHLGVNPAWPVPEVPPVFRWRSPDGAEVTVAYQAGGYGGEVVVPGCDEALAFLHAGDNLGPPTVLDVRTAHAALRDRYPEAEVRASTLDAFARALGASDAEPALPVVTAEIGDPWLFGAGSDPQKVAAFRGLLADRLRPEVRASLADDARTAIERQLLLVAEHTWGLDQKVALPDDRSWDAPGLAAVRSTAAGQRFEASWAEQRRYVDDARAALAGAVGQGRSSPSIRDRARRGVVRIGPDGAPEGRYERLTDGVVPPSDHDADGTGLDVRVDVATGAIVRLADRASGRVLADADHPLGLVRHQRLAEADYDRFYAQLTPVPADEGWARWDNTKPGIDACGATSGVDGLVNVSIWVAEQPDGRWRDLVVAGAMAPSARAQGAPEQVLVRWRWGVGGAGEELHVEVGWPDKPATRLPEATWVSFVPRVAAPERWTMDKLGQEVSPLDVVRRGGRSLHAVGEGVRYDGPDGGLAIRTPDAPLVAPGRPNLLDADPPVPDLAGGWHVLLHDNCWGTNFPMWNEGPASFRFTLELS